MKITSSNLYLVHKGVTCPEDIDCERNYCSTHRLLFRTCESRTIQEGETASWEDGGSKHWIEYTNECIPCHNDYERKKFAQYQEAHHS